MKLLASNFMTLKTPLFITATSASSDIHDSSDFTAGSSLTTDHDADVHDHSEDEIDYQSGFLSFVVLNIWATFSNILVLIVMSRSRTLRRSFGCVVISLSTTDLLTSVCITPMAIYYYYHCGSWHFGKVACIGWVTTNIFLCTTSVSHHCLIAVNRYLAVAKPHEQRRIKITTTAGLVYRVILPAWSSGFLLAIILGVQSTFHPQTVISEFSTSSSREVVSCRVVDRPFVIYTSVASLVPLVVIVLANVASILVLRRRLKQRELTRIIMATRKRPSNISTSTGEEVIINNGNAEAGGGDNSTTVGNMGLIVRLDKSQTDSARSSLYRPKELKNEGKRRKSSLWTLRAFARMIDYYLTQTEEEDFVENQPISSTNRFSIRKRLTTARGKASNRHPHKPLKVAGNASPNSPRAARPNTLALPGSSNTSRRSSKAGIISKPGTPENNIDKRSSNTSSSRRASRAEINETAIIIAKPSSRRSSKTDVNLLLKQDSGEENSDETDALLSKKSSLIKQNTVQVPTDSDIAAIMESIREDDIEMESSTIADLEPLPQKSLTKAPRRPCMRTISDVTFVSMTSDVFGDDYRSFHEGLTLSVTRPDLFTSIFNSNASDDSSSYNFNFFGDERQQLEEEDGSEDDLDEEEDSDFCSEESRKNQARKLRKRAFSIDLPLRYIFAQKAPLAKFEGKSSFSINRIEASSSPVTNQAIPIKPPQKYQSQIPQINVTDNGSVTSPHYREVLLKKQSSACSSNFGFQRLRSNTQPKFPKRIFRILSNKRFLMKKIENKISDTTSPEINASVAIKKVPITSHQLRPQSFLNRAATIHVRSPVTHSPSRLQRIHAPAQDHGALLGVPNHAPLTSVVSTDSSQYESRLVEVCSNNPDEKICTKRSHPIPGQPSIQLRRRLTKRNLSRSDQQTVIARRFRKRERQAERALILVLLFLICLWLPYFMTNLIYGICPSCVSQNAHDLFHVIAVSSTGAINPLVYILASRDFKKALVRLFKKRQFVERNTVLYRSASRASTGQTSVAPSSNNHVIVDGANLPLLVVENRVNN